MVRFVPPSNHYAYLDFPSSTGDELLSFVDFPLVDIEFGWIFRDNLHIIDTSKTRTLFVLAVIILV